MLIGPLKLSNYPCKNHCPTKIKLYFAVHQCNLLYYRESMLGELVLKMDGSIILMLIEHFTIAQDYMHCKNEIVLVTVFLCYCLLFLFKN